VHLVRFTIERTAVLYLHVSREIAVRCSAIIIRLGAGSRSPEGPQCTYTSPVKAYSCRSSSAALPPENENSLSGEKETRSCVLRRIEKSIVDFYGSGVCLDLDKGMVILL